MRVSVTVKPNSKKGPLVEETDAGLIVYVREPAIDGKANKAVIELLAKYHAVPKGRVSVVRGVTGRIKLIDIEVG